MRPPHSPPPPDHAPDEEPEAADMLTADLRALGRAAAPAALLSGVLARTTRAGDRYVVLDGGRLGPLYVAFNPAGISALRLAPTDAGFETWFQKRVRRPARRAEEVEAPAALLAGVRRALAGEARGKDLRYDLRILTEFERAVLRKALEIPRGEVRSYAWVAREIGHPRAVRAVGTALGHNPVPLLIPCHRVVNADNRVGKYAFGTEVKRAVLTDEGLDLDALESLGRQGVRFNGSDTTRVYCFPTCRHARRVMDRHRVAFASASAAAARGYRPCKVCRPAERAA